MRHNMSSLLCIVAGDNHPNSNWLLISNQSHGTMMKIFSLVIKHCSSETGKKTGEKSSKGRKGIIIFWDRVIKKWRTLKTWRTWVPITLFSLFRSEILRSAQTWSWKMLISLVARNLLPLRSVWCGLLEISLVINVSYI